MARTNSVYAMGDLHAGKRELKRTPIQINLALIGMLLGISCATIGVRYSVGPFGFYAVSVFGALAAATLLYPDRISKYRPGILDAAILAFIALTYTSELINAEQLLREANPHISYTWVIIYLGYVATRISVANPGDALSFAIGFLAPAPVLAVFGVLQALRFDPAVQITAILTPAALSRYEDADGLVRATGLIGHWTGFGSYLAAMTLLTLIIMLNARASRGTVALLLLIGLGTVSTLTFSVIVVYATMVVSFYLYKRQAGRLLVLLAVGCAAVAYWLGDILVRRFNGQFGNNAGSFSSSNGLIPETLVYRARIWSTETLPAVLERPLLGWGHGVYDYSRNWPIAPQSIVWNSPESQWLGILMFSGVIGALALSFIIVAMFIVAWKIERGERLMVSLFIILCLVTSTTVPQFTNSGLPMPLIIILGLIGYAQPMAFNAINRKL